jgi:hypothetical protein
MPALSFELPQIEIFVEIFVEVRICLRVHDHDALLTRLFARRVV